MNNQNWYWIDGSAYCPACVECDTPAIDAADATMGPCQSGCCACCGESATASDYSVAFVRYDGSWDIVETFRAAGDAAANAYAEENYGEQEWYVLDANGRNINGGVDG